MDLFWTALLGLIALGWIIGGLRMARGMAGVPRMADIPPLPDAECPPVSILVPARDEAAGLRQSLPTLLAQDYPRCEVIVVNDRSRDATAQVLNEFAGQHKNLKVIQVGELPAGWLGKPHALTVGCQHATGEWLVFTDADVRFAPDLLRRALTLVKQKGWDHLTAWPLLDLVGFWEKMAISFWVLSSALYLEPWRVSDRRSRRYFSAGAFQLLRRSAHETIGTHRRLALEVVDDLKLGKLVKEGGFRSGMALVGEQLRLRYQEGLGGIVRGLTKNSFAACGFRLRTLAFNLFLGFAFDIFPFLALLVHTGRARVLAAVSVAVALVLHASVARSIRVSPFYALTHPLGAVFLLYIVLRSAAVTLWRGGVFWRDTFYPLKDLRKGLV